MNNKFTFIIYIVIFLISCATTSLDRYNKVNKNSMHDLNDFVLNEKRNQKDDHTAKVLKKANSHIIKLELEFDKENWVKVDKVSVTDLKFFIEGALTKKYSTMAKNLIAGLEKKEKELFQKKIAYLYKQNSGYKNIPWGINYNDLNYFFEELPELSEYNSKNSGVFYSKVITYENVNKNDFTMMEIKKKNTEKDIYRYIFLKNKFFAVELDFENKKKILTMLMKKYRRLRKNITKKSYKLIPISYKTFKIRQTSYNLIFIKDKITDIAFIGKFEDNSKYNKRVAKQMEYEFKKNPMSGMTSLMMFNLAGGGKSDSIILYFHHKSLVSLKNQLKRIRFKTKIKHRNKNESDL